MGMYGLTNSLYPSLGKVEDPGITQGLGIIYFDTIKALYFTGIILCVFPMNVIFVGI